jgi:hypothetical protein
MTAKEIITALDELKDFELDLLKKLAKINRNWVPKIKVAGRRGRNIIMATKVLFPEATLQSVANEYGITREAVRVVANSVFAGIPWRKLKKGFLYESEKFVCVVCGSIIPLERRNGIGKYCSRKCGYLLKFYDMTRPMKCRYCRRVFFRNRKYKNTEFGNYCCVSHGALHRFRLSTLSSFYRRIIGGGKK